MSRTARGRQRRPPQPPPVTPVTLNEEHIGKRLLFSVLFLLLGIGLLVFTFVRFLSPDSEWITVEAGSSAGASCAEDFAFLYRPASGGFAAAEEKKSVARLYTEQCRKAFELFHGRMEFEGVVNVRTIALHPNEELTVSPPLYRALEAVVKSGNRVVYLGPIYSRYSDLFFCEDDSQLVDFDPRLSEDVREEYAAVARYASAPDSVSLELLGNNRVRLFVSEEYLAFAEEEGIDAFIDFSWMQNAFMLDVVADALIEQGYTNGAITTCDGFVRNLDASGTEYSFQLCSRRGNTVYIAANMRYHGPRSMVFLRDYPINDQDAERFYTLKTGERRTPYLDISDGLCKNALPELICYDSERGCGEVLLSMLPAFIAESFDETALRPLAREGIQFIYFKDDVLRYTDRALTVDDLLDEEGARYSMAPAFD